MLLMQIVSEKQGNMKQCAGHRKDKFFI